MTSVKKSIVAVALAAFLGMGALTPFTAKASEAGRKNTTLAVGALTGVLLAKKKWIPAAVTGVGTYYAYHNWQAQINARHRKQNQLAYRHAYNLGYNRAHTTRVRRSSVVHRTRTTRHRVR